MTSSLAISLQIFFPNGTWVGFDINETFLTPRRGNAAADESRTDGGRVAMDINEMRQKQSAKMHSKHRMLWLSWRRQVRDSVIPITCDPSLTCCCLVISWKKHQSFNPGQCFSDPYCDAEAVTPVLSRKTKTARTCNSFFSTHNLFSRIQSRTVHICHSATVLTTVLLDVFTLVVPSHEAKELKYQSVLVVTVWLTSRLMILCETRRHKKKPGLAACEKAGPE